MTLAALAAGFVATATLPAMAWPEYSGTGYGVSVGFGTEPYYESYAAYTGPGGCTCSPRVAYRGFGTGAYAYGPGYDAAYAYAPGSAYGYDDYAYAPDYAYGGYNDYAYAPEYAYGYGDYGYSPGVSVGVGFSSDRNYRYGYRSGNWRGDHRRTVSRNRDFVRTNVRTGAANFGTDTTIRSGTNRTQFSGTRTNARVATEGRGGWSGQGASANAQFRAGGNVALRNGGAVKGAPRGNARREMR
jgi:hypothetical protein